jgi:hypothetical protein
MKTWIIVEKESCQILQYYYAEEKNDNIPNQVDFLAEPTCIHLELSENFNIDNVKVELIDGEYIIVLDEERISARNARMNNYAIKRQQEYPSIEDQLDMQYWDKVNGTNNWQETINTIKVKYPKN